MTGRPILPSWSTLTAFQPQPPPGNLGAAPPGAGAVRGPQGVPQAAPVPVGALHGAAPLAGLPLPPAINDAQIEQAAMHGIPAAAHAAAVARPGAPAHVLMGAPGVDRAEMAAAEAQRVRAAGRAEMELIAHHAGIPHPEKLTDWQLYHTIASMSAGARSAGSPASFGIEPVTAQAAPAGAGR